MPQVQPPTTAQAPPGNPAFPINLLLESQRAFFRSGQTLPLSFRVAQLQALRQSLHRYEHQLIEAMHTDFRKPEMETFTTEVGFVEQELKLVLDKLPKWIKRKRVGESILNFPAKSYIYPEPYGVALIIAPWNYPLQLIVNPLIGAMAAGNCAILKPSELAQNTSAVLASMIRETFDESYVALVEGGPETGQLLLKQRFDYIFFTGNTRVAKSVMKAAAEHLTPLTLELGGKSPAIIGMEADLELAARRITWGKFMNAGQTCVAPDYVLIREQVKEEFIQLMIQSIKDFYGTDPSQSPDYARIIDNRHFERLASYLQNATVRIGGQTDAASRYIAPTILDNITWDQPVMQEEIFGPILPVLSYNTLDELAMLVNNHTKPLALYFFSSNKAKQKRILRELSFGGGCINDTVSHLINPNLPFGGIGGSGIGSYHGKASFEVFTHKKSVVHRGTWLDLPLRYPPYRNRLAFLRRLLAWL